MKQKFLKNTSTVRFHVKSKFFVCFEVHIPVVKSIIPVSSGESVNLGGDKER